MLLGMKFSPRDGEMFINNIAELESEGVMVNGFELQVLAGDTPETVLEGIDLVRDHFDAKFTGLHPPFPLYADKNALFWESVAHEARLDYTVAHASIPNGNFTDIYPAVRNLLTSAKGTIFLENVPLRGNKEGGGSLLDIALLHDKLLVDIPHTIYNWEHGLRTNISPEKQVDMVLPAVKAVHVADNDNGDGAVPVGGGSKMFRLIMSHLFPKKDIMYVAEPTGGHKQDGAGHKETCREIWRLWTTF